MIPVEAVEAAIAAYYEHGEPDSEADELVAMRAAIEAAAPFIQSAAWDDGWDAGMRFQPNKTNPYRPAK